MQSTLVSLALAVGAASATIAAPAAYAQQGTSPQQRYERQVAACNSGTLSAPEREGCIRAAGTDLDNTRGGTPPAEVQRTTPDGRATVVTPSDARTPATGATTTTTPDGRATVVPPSDRSAPR